MVMRMTVGRRRVHAGHMVVLVVLVVLVTVVVVHRFVSVGVLSLIHI